jgi:hypothetical protein
MRPNFLSIVVMRKNQHCGYSLSVSIITDKHGCLKLSLCLTKYHTVKMDESIAPCILNLGT